MACCTKRSTTVGIGGDSQKAHLAVVLGYFYPLDGVRTVRAVHQGTDMFILVGQKPWGAVAHMTFRRYHHNPCFSTQPYKLG